MLSEKKNVYIFANFKQDLGSGGWKSLDKNKDGARERKYNSGYFENSHDLRGKHELMNVMNSLLRL